MTKVESKTDETTEEKKPAKSKAGKLSPTVARLKSRNSLLIIVLIVIALVPSVYFYSRSRQAEQRLNDPNTANQKVIDEVVRKVGRHILLPSGEQPTLATVSDVTKVKGQPFFANASNGDKVLVYTQARKAILYRPSKDIVIEVAPLNIDASQLKATSQ